MNTEKNKEMKMLAKEILECAEKNSLIMLHMHSKGLIFRTTLNVESVSVSDKGFTIFADNTIYTFFDFKSIENVEGDNDNIKSYILTFKNLEDMEVYIDFI